MNNKGMTDVILVLVLSGIAVALIFIGIIYTYTSLACYTGVNIQQSKFISAYTPGQMVASGIELIEVKSSDSGCDTTTPPNCKNVTYTFRIKYMGASDARVSILGKEKQSTMDVDTDIYRDTTPNQLRINDEYSFIREFPKYTCDGGADFNLTIFAIGTSGVSNKTWSAHNDYCMSPAARDVNVSANSISNVGGNIVANVSITGADVEKLCPQATAWISIRRNNYQFTDALLVNSTGWSSGICSFVVDTNTTRVESNGWYPDNRYNFRTKIIVTNDTGATLVSGELVEATIVFPPETQMLSCTALIVTDKSGITYLARKVFSEIYTGGFCHSAKIWFTSGTAFSWVNNQKIFYVYSTNESITRSNDNIDSFYPKIIFNNFGGTGCQAVNITPVAGSVKLVQTC
jgi:hypothetical protein